MSHKKIEKECAEKLERDASRYKEGAKSLRGKKQKRHEKTEEREAKAAAKSMKRFAKKAHEY